MKILVTGCAGFIGFHVCKKLISSRNEVLGIDNLNSAYETSLKKERLDILRKSKNFKFEKKDLRLTDSLDSFKCDYVVHLAARAGVFESSINPKDYYFDNILGHFNVLEFCRKNKLPLIYASSSSVYNNINNEPIRENAILDPKSFYGFTKKSNEKLSKFYSKNFNLKQIGLRFFSVYGSMGRPDMAYWIFSKKIANNNTLEIFGDGSQTRDMTHVSDVAEYVEILLNEKLPNPHMLFNICRGETHSLNTILMTISSKLKRSPIIDYQSPRSCEAKFNYGCNKKIKKITGYAPKISIDEGMDEFLYWFKKYDHNFLK
tara:strand:- start:634 stop:1584 length:951 start_codon:yes stop_codon:yes gene_type:complete